MCILIIVVKHFYFWLKVKESKTVMNRTLP